MTITLVILAVAVVFVLWRLSSVLGQDQGFIPQFDRDTGGPERTEAATDEPASPQEPFSLSRDDVDPASDYSEIQSRKEKKGENKQGRKDGQGRNEPRSRKEETKVQEGRKEGR